MNPEATTELSDLANASQLQTQTDKWTPDDGNKNSIGVSLIIVEKQWDRITERGAVLSRYICSDYKPEQLNFAVCENKGTSLYQQIFNRLLVKGWRIYDSENMNLTQNRLQEFTNKFGPKVWMGFVVTSN
jgi:hypothetical protein